jgi:insertion element IS1 protein InsB
MTWLQDFINNLYRSVPIEIMVRETSDLEIEIECDELWSYVNSKENPVSIWLAIARKSRQIVGFHLGDPAGIRFAARSRLSAMEFWKTLPQTYQENGKFYTDLWESYCEVIPSGAAALAERDRHYPSTKKSGETTRIERLNNTLRHRCSRLVRKNLAFSKNFFNHEGAILYFIHHYNEEILST